MIMLDLLRELSAHGIFELAMLIGFPLYTRYMFRKLKQDILRDLNQILDEKFKELGEKMDARFDAIDSRF